MGIFDFLGSGYDDRPASYEQPQTEYPTIEEDDTSKLCRACSGGLGDGICSYHASKFHVQIKKERNRGKR